MTWLGEHLGRLGLAGFSEQGESMILSLSKSTPERRPSRAANCSNPIACILRLYSAAPDYIILDSASHFCTLLRPAVQSAWMLLYRFAAAKRCFCSWRRLITHMKSYVCRHGRNSALSSPLHLLATMSVRQYSQGCSMIHLFGCQLHICACSIWFLSLIRFIRIMT